MTAIPAAFSRLPATLSILQLAGAGVDGDPGQCLGAVEHHQDVASYVVAQLHRRNVLTLLLQRHVGDGKQHVLSGFKANPVPIEVPDIAAQHGAVDHLVGVHKTAVLFWDGVAMDYLRRRRLPGCTVNGSSSSGCCSAN